MRWPRRRTPKPCNHLWTEWSRAISMSPVHVTVRRCLLCDKTDQFRFTEDQP